MNPQQTKKESVRFLSRIAKSGDRLSITIPLEMHNEIEPLKNKPISVTIKEVRLD